MINLYGIQKEQKEWALRNFGNNPSYYSLLGLVEEVGELAHSHLKLLQNIRTNEDHVALKKDAIGDAIIFLIGYCNQEDFDLEDIIKDTWISVKERDWIKNKINGQEPI